MTGLGFHKSNKHDKVLGVSPAKNENPIINDGVHVAKNTAT